MQMTKAMKDDLEKAKMYGLLADYYKYLNPEMHIWYYRLHENHMRCFVYAQSLEYRTYNDAYTNVEYQPYNYGQSNSWTDTQGMRADHHLALVRIMHASPDAPAVDIYMNGQLTLSRVSYKDASDVLQVPSGNYQIHIYPAGQTNRPVLSSIVQLQAGQAYTLIAAGTLQQLELLVYVDDQRSIDNKAKVRLIHLSPDAPAVDVAIKKGPILFTDVAFRQATEYGQVDPGTYTLEVRAAGTQQVVLEISDVMLSRNQNYTIFALGFAEMAPHLEALLLQDA